MKNYQALLLVLMGVGIAYTTATGYLQTVTHFENVANEIAMFILAHFVMLIGLMSIDVHKLIKGFM
jgi:hypothetical protein